MKTNSIDLNNTKGMDLSNVTGDEKTACGRKPLFNINHKKDIWKKCIDDYTKKNPTASTTTSSSTVENVVTEKKPANTYDFPNLSDGEFAASVYRMLSAKKLYDTGTPEFDILSKSSVKPEDISIFLTKLKDPDTYVQINSEASKRNIDLQKLMTQSKAKEDIIILGSDIAKVSNTKLVDTIKGLTILRDDVKMGLDAKRLSAKYGFSEGDSAIIIAQINDPNLWKTVSAEFQKRKLDINKEMTKKLTDEKLKEIKEKYLGSHPIVAKAEQTMILPISSAVVLALGGAFFAYKTNRGVLGYVASILIGSAVGFGAGYGIKAIMTKQTNK